MKKLILSAAIAVFGLTLSQAQTEQGNWVFGGESSFSFTSNTETAEFDGEEVPGELKTSTINLGVDAGYFVMDNLAVGLELGMGNTTQKYEEDGEETESKTNSFAVLPQATYYFKNDNFAPFLGVKVGYMAMGGEEDVTKFGGLAFGGEAGVAYFINNVSIDFSVNYTNATLSNKEESDFKSKYSILGVGIGFSIFL